MVLYEISDEAEEWQFREFVMPLGRPTITSWRTALTPRRRADLDAFLIYISRLDNWTHPIIKPLAGKQFSGLSELRWKSENVPHRIGGFLVSRKAFVMLIGFTHNANKYDPPNALNTLVERKKKLDRKEAELREYKIITGK